MLKEVKLIWRCPYLHDRHEFGTMEAVSEFVERYAEMKPVDYNRKAVDRLRVKLLRVLRDPKGKSIAVDVATLTSTGVISFTLTISHRNFDYYMRTFRPGEEPPAESTKIKIPV